MWELAPMSKENWAKWWKYLTNDFFLGKEHSLKINLVSDMIDLRGRIKGKKSSLNYLKMHIVFLITFLKRFPNFLNPLRCINILLKPTLWTELFDYVYFVAVVTNVIVICSSCEIFVVPLSKLNGNNLTHILMILMSECDSLLK